MIDSVNKIILEIEGKIGEENFDSEIEGQIEDLKSIGNVDLDVIDKLLHLFEKNLNFEFGSPGELTHYLESFYKHGYEEKLIESIQRIPTEHTLWMLHRIINGSSNQEKEIYLKILKSIYSDKSIDQKIRTIAKEFYELH